MFLDRVQSTPDRQAFQYPTADGWGSITWAQTGERVRAIACGLHALGLQPEQRVGLVSNTRYEWILCDLGALCAGCATTTVYPSNTADECAYILTDSASQVVFAEDDSQVAKLVEKRSALGGIKQVITIDGQAGHDGWVITLAELEQKGRQWEKQNDGKYQATVEAIRPEQLATLIYTSGTTGRPKGVELTHDCWIATGQGIDGLGILSIADHQYLWLPLAHSFGKVLQTAQLAIGFSTTVDGRIPKLVENLAVVKPTFMAAAPRIFEKVYNKVVTGAQEAGGLKSKIFGWAVKNGRKVSELRQRGEEPSGFLALKYAIAEKLVFSKLQALFGGRLRFFISGSAPLSRDIAEFFHAAGVLILEGYGLTETSAASFVNRPNDYKFGTVGKGLGDMRVKIAEEDGEILLAGRGVMRGYHNLAEATAEVLPGDGWFRTGDIGEVDAEGFLRITDRKKDLIKTSGGKYVAPQNLESKLKTLCPYIGNVVVHGDKRNFCTALITIDEESITKWAADNGVSGDYRALTQHEKVRQMVQDAVDQLNAGLARYETIKKFAILESDFSVESGELTPSLKVKRKEVERRYASVLDQFYQGQLAS
ncbi:MAG: long-chain fatty acid--CoA ligase [Deltaproteobacteria bacterium]|nr:long-chain fatty acid--CoA ligase [Deltaproteobacteria bacterium]